MRRFSSPSREGGAILIVSLWALVILSIISVAVSSLVSPQIKLAKSMEDRFASLAAAESVLKLAWFSRSKDPTPDYDSLQEWPASEILLGKVRASYHLTDEEDKINLNFAAKEAIMRLPGLNDERLVDGIIAYREEQPFILKEELLLVAGMSPEIFKQCQDSITVWTEGAVNINTAPAEALRVLGLSQDLIEVILRFRKGEDGLEATADDNIFKDINTVINDLHRFTSLTVGEVAQLQNALSGDLLTVCSKKFTLELQTNFLNQPPRHFRISFDAENNRVLLWQER